MEACWHQDRIKNRCQLRKADFAKTIEKQMNVHCFLQFLGSKLAKDQSKFDQKMKPKMDCLLASIFDGF